MLLYQPEFGYCYNSDSLFLYDFVNAFKPKGRVLDVGVGCGIVGLLVARDNPNITLEGVEKQADFVEYAKINARVNKIEYELYQSDFLELDEDKKYDFIISNPPFYREDSVKSENEMLRGARYNINLPIEHFFKKVSRLLKPHSHFVFCYDASQFAQLCAELEKVKLSVVDVRFVHSKVDKKASLVLVHARNGSKSMMKVWHPLITMESGNYSNEAQNIYDNSKTQSIKCQI